ncbi:methyltransferase [Sedimenticola thiotaurini]|uniref:Ribosomal RNA large subunit methyltransferase G n=1 Tax=Sedimenticola thiotaurini TaxID=1543721 RepID=A0A0F7JSA1_9GAMM|nr:methyltransferase [Sedimenticola thiotaurini]AKH19361.1 50S rRNA methyltransferase [Sedimenticola thiotaurini]
MQQLEVPTGRFILRRYPLRKRETLRAWDAADEYLLDHLGQEVNGRVLIVNDTFGALSVALSQWAPTHQSDSFLATWSARENLAANGYDPERIDFITALDKPQGLYDLVLVRVTKTQGLLEHELIQLRSHLAPDARLIGCGMARQIHTSTLQLFERIIGPTTTSLARKKARLIFASPEPTLEESDSPYPVRYLLEGSGFQLVNHANVFSRDKLDIGTRLLLEHIPADNGYRDIIDLGCGNGVVGLIAAQHNPAATIHFVDESAMAVASAQATYAGAGLPNPARFVQGDALSQFPPASADLILCNPPFHQGNVVGDEIAWRMFNQARRTLRKGGELRIIGNRHLNYHVKLKRLFGNVQQMAANRKFVVLKSFKNG